MMSGRLLVWVTNGLIYKEIDNEYFDIYAF